MGVELDRGGREGGRTGVEDVGHFLFTLFFVENEELVSGRDVN